MPGIGIGLGLGMGVGKPQASLFNRVRQALFGSGEQGIYMPSVHESFLRGDLYQDAAGNTPVTAVGQSVGLWLDRSEGLVPGPELYAGGSTPQSPPYAEKIGDVWHLSRDASGAGSVILASGLKSATTYEVRLTAYPTGPGASHYIDIRGGNSGGGQISLSPILFHEPVDVVCRIRTGVTGVEVSANNPNIDCSWSFNNVSVRELPGNHASQSSASLRPAYQTAPERLDFDAVDDKLTATFASSLGSACTVGLSVPGSGASILTAQTIGTSYDITADHCGIVIVNRALTAGETDRLTQLLNQAAGV